MKNLTNVYSFFLLAVILFGGVMFSLASTNPNLGMTDSFSVLSSTYSNTVAGTIINGDLGYTTGPATVPTVTKNTHVADSTYNQAGIDQGAALVALNNQVCTYTFPAGPIDLSTDTTHGAIGIYTPGVYCVTGAVTIGTAGITLDGAGTYIFKINGALNTVANSVITLSNSASTCDVWWAPTEATTLGANSTFKGTNIDAAGITIGDTVNWAGRALSFGGTISTVNDNVTVPVCTAPIIITPVVTVATVTPVVVPVVVVATTTPIIVPVLIATATPVVIMPVVTSVSVPKLPNTGAGSDTQNSNGLLILAVIAISSLLTAYAVRMKKI